MIAGGGESMNNISYSIKEARWRLRLRQQEPSEGIWDGLTDHHIGLIMGMTDENGAERCSISREDQDEFAYSSRMRAKKALETGRFKDAFRWSFRGRGASPVSWWIPTNTRGRKRPSRGCASCRPRHADREVRYL